jgi:hypothetical protein
MTPATARDSSSTAIERAKPKMRYDTNDPKTLSRMIGRRPTRSEIHPQTGAKKNCMREYSVPISPTSSALA